MLISRMSEGEEMGAGTKKKADAEDHSNEYQTASELFELMSINHFDAKDDDSLTPRDLVILYKNIDKGTNSISNGNEFKQQKPNQYVETIVYNEDLESGGSDVSDVYSMEDLQSVFSVNKERMDFFSSHPSFENNLCQKFGDIEIQSSNLTTEYNKNFFFQDPYIKDQLNALNFGSSQCEGSLLPASLLDYICCKRLEDNYNFYMDSIIIYVKHTIEQLKRISNGEYLTDRTKEKWKEVDNPEIDKSIKMLAKSTSIPLHVERKNNRHATTWDDLVHSEVDVRSLSKILEKKIVIEVPRLICGSYRLFSRRCADNLIISCKHGKRHTIEEEKEEENTSRVDLVFQLQRSQSGHMMSNINSIIILQTPTNIVDNYAEPLLPLQYKEIENIEATDETIKITEIYEDDDPNTEASTNSETHESKDAYFGEHVVHCDSIAGTNDYPCSENECNISKNQSYSESSDSTEVLRNFLSKEPLLHTEPTFNIASPDELRLTMQRLNTQVCLPEESGEDVSLGTNTISKNKSPTRTRIKSPYENQSFVLEEKKRKRLLEIREKRERKKLALGESCKISKHKYPKGVVMAQSSSSVTKLSITNKSFYNSIYGQAIAMENNKQLREKGRPGIKKDSIPEVPLDQIGADDELPPITTERSSKKYFNRSYYLDDAITEVMYMEMKNKNNCDMKACSAATSAVSSDFRDNLNLLLLIGSSATDLNKEDTTSDNTPTLNETLVYDDKKEISMVVNVHTPQSVENKVPVNSPHNASSDTKSDLKKTTDSVECRKSIDKIYDLMKKLEKGVNDVKLPPKNKSISPLDIIQGRESSTIQGSDSGTSVKHHLTSSNPSCFSFEKTHDFKCKMSTIIKPQTPVVPKVIISSRSQTSKSDDYKSKKNKKVLLNASKSGENPLKAISQLLHDFDNIQKTRQKTAEPKGIKKPELTPSDVKNGSRRGTTRRHSRFDQHFNACEYLEKKSVLTTPRRPLVNISKLKQSQSLVEKDKISKKVTVDIIEEAKEARGEAVRGPSKFHSRLNSLAQPKKSYVQAHSEEYQTKYGKNLMADRLQRLASTRQSFLERNVGSANSRNRLKKNGAEAVSSESMKPPPQPPIEVRVQRSASTSPKRKSLSPMTPFKYNNVPQTPETLKKMVAVETYVKGHYGCASLPSTSGEVLQLGHMSRVPLLPKDIDLISVTSTNTAEESNELGSKLHRIINTMLNTNSPPLAVLSERFETSSKSNNTEESSLADSLSRGDERLSVDSDFPVDIFEDKNIITAVAEDDKNFIETNEESSKCEQPEGHNFTTELAKLENALCHQLTVGAFQKRLRIKNLTLTPKQSIKPPFLLQSGDTGSILLKSTLSQNFKTSSHDKLGDFKALPVLSKSDLDWSFVKFPLQMATVGYTFPKYPALNLETNTVKLLRDDHIQTSKIGNIKVVKNGIKSSQTPKCPKAEEPKEKLEHAIQVDVEENSVTVNVNYENNTTNENETVSDDVTKLDFDIKSKTIPQPINEKDIISSKKINDDSVDYTTSLDMLVGLLNEIQKITTCQTHITNGDPNEQQCKELETIINDAAALEKYSNNSPNEIVSITSLDRLRKLESSPSIYTFYLSSDGEHDLCDNSPKDKCFYRPIYEDKEVYADFDERETVNRFTEVPSIFPITINHSTNVTNSVIGVLSEPSSQSLFSSFYEYKSICSKNSFNTQKRITELPQLHHKLSRQSVVPYENKNKVNKDNIDLNVATSIEKQEINQDIRTWYKKVDCKRGYVQDFDPTLKMKKDILVTVYSILVFTVFAALSFPEVMYRA